MSQDPFANQQPIPGVKHIVLVASGKGGVGKSTVSTNLAMALREYGKVGLLDADIYGPSLPRLMGALNQRPEVDDQQKLTPIKRHGLQLMSIGFLTEEDAAVVWRGPMLFKAISQFLFDVKWDNLDYLVIDLPPGTGDVQLTLAQKVPVSGAVAVTTPQNLALVDVKKAVDMFNRIQIPLLGVIENMSAFRTAEGEVDMFPGGELNKWLEENKLEKLGKVAFNPSIAMACEAGIPIVESNPASEDAKQFMDIAKGLHEKLNSFK